MLVVVVLLLVVDFSPSLLLSRLSLEEGPVRRQIIAVWSTAATTTEEVEESNHRSLGVVLLLHVSRHISLRQEDRKEKTHRHTHTLTLGTIANWPMSTGHNTVHCHSNGRRWLYCCWHTYFTFPHSISISLMSILPLPLPPVLTVVTVMATESRSGQNKHAKVNIHWLY